MKPNPENLKDWTLPAELPSAFALPQEFRQSLPNEVQQWLDSVEKRIDGMTLKRIEKEADRLAGEDNPEAGKLVPGRVCQRRNRRRADTERERRLNP